MSEQFWIGGAVVLFVIWRITRSVLAQSKVAQLRMKGALIIDVRSPAEFASSHAVGSLNIPLSELHARIGELPRDRPLILCCASGARSGAARQQLRAAGFSNVYNAGSWRNCA